MIKVFAIQQGVNPWDRKVHVHLRKGGVEFELTNEELNELFSVLNGKRQVLHTAPKEGDYHPEYIYLFNHDQTK